VGNAVFLSVSAVYIRVSAIVYIWDSLVSLVAC